MLTTRSELAEVANFLVDLLPNLRPDSVMLHAAPITHGSGAFFLPHLVKGAAQRDRAEVLARPPSWRPRRSTAPRRRSWSRR